MSVHVMSVRISLGTSGSAVHCAWGLGRGPEVAGARPPGPGGCCLRGHRPCLVLWPHDGQGKNTLSKNLPGKCAWREGLVLGGGMPTGGMGSRSPRTQIPNRHTAAPAALGLGHFPATPSKRQHAPQVLASSLPRFQENNCINLGLVVPHGGVPSTRITELDPDAHLPVASLQTRRGGSWSRGQRSPSPLVGQQNWVLNCSLASCGAE